MSRTTPARDKIDLAKPLRVLSTDEWRSQSSPGLHLWNPVAENCSRRLTLMQVFVTGMHFNTASPFPAACFHTSIGAGDTLKRSQPRQSVRRELLPLEHLRGRALVGLAHAPAGARLRRLPCSLAARLLVFSFRCSLRRFFTRCHLLVRAPPHGGCKKRRGWFRAEQGGVEAVRGGEKRTEASWNGGKRDGNGPPRPRHCA